jgi:hypothetical protein
MSSSRHLDAALLFRLGIAPDIIVAARIGRAGREQDMVLGRYSLKGLPGLLNGLGLQANVTLQKAKANVFVIGIRAAGAQIVQAVAGIVVVPLRRQAATGVEQRGIR